MFDNGCSKQATALQNGNIQLEGGFSSSMQKISRKTLIWEKDGKQAAEWVYEMPGGSRRVALKLDLRALIDGERHDYRKGEYHYQFSLIGCEVNLLLSRNAADSGEPGHQNLRVYLGLRESTTRSNPPGPTNSVDTITCRAQVEVWDAQKKTWVLLWRSAIRRYPAGSSSGTHSAVSLACLKEIIPPQRSYGELPAHFRVTITDIGLLELSREHVIGPS